MKLLFKYIDNEILIDKNKVLSFEIENKAYFYRIVNDFNTLANGEISDTLHFFNEDSFEEINMTKKINIITDYFNFDLSNKKIINKIYEIIASETNLNEQDKINKAYNKIYHVFSSKLNNFDLLLTIENEFKVEDVIKIFKIKINRKENLLDNLLNLIDVIKIISPNEFYIFINLKQYLSFNELNEFYKYTIYNNINIVMIDSYSYGLSLENEKKIVIDTDLFEIML